MSFIWHNGKIRDDGPVFTAHDRLRLGEGVFNTMLAIDGKIIHCALYCEKILKNSVIFFGEWEKPSAQSLEDAAHELLNKNGYSKGRYAMNTIISRGVGGNALRFAHPKDQEFQIVIRALPAPYDFQPIHAVITKDVRRNEGSPLTQIKCSNYGENILALREAEARGGNEAIMMNNRGDIACATTANVLAVIDGKLVTPPLKDGTQGGITRTLLMHKFDIEERSLKPEDLKNSQGIYLTNTLRGVAPVITLDGQAMPTPAIAIEKDFNTK